MSKPRGRGAVVRRWLLVVVALVVINAPWVVGVWHQHQISSDGIRVTATIAAARVQGDSVLVDVRFPRSVDPAQTVHAATIDRATYDGARDQQEIGARVLSGHPSVFRLDGQLRSHVGTVVTVIGDAFVALLLLLSFRLGGRLRRPDLVAVALGDVSEGGPESLLDRQDDGTYVICGEVKQTGDHSIVLALRDRDVTVHLQGHANPVSASEPAQVRASLVG